jgi:hypothetical protein
LIVPASPGHSKINAGSSGQINTGAGVIRWERLGDYPNESDQH